MISFQIDTKNKSLCVLIARHKMNCSVKTSGVQEIWPVTLMLLYV